MEDRIRELLGELKAGLAQLYGERLKGVYVYGSYARGEQDNESDLDVLIVLDHFDHYGAEIERTGELGAALSLEYGVTVTKIFMREHDWLEGDTPFLLNVREEAVPA